MWYALSVNYQAYLFGDQEKIFLSIKGLMLVLPDDVQESIQTMFDDAENKISQYYNETSGIMDDTARLMTNKEHRQRYLKPINEKIIKQMYKTLRNSGYFIQDRTIKPEDGQDEEML